MTRECFICLVRVAISPKEVFHVLVPGDAGQSEDYTKRAQYPSGCDAGLPFLLAFKDSQGECLVCLARLCLERIRDTLWGCVRRFKGEVGSWGEGEILWLLPEAAQPAAGHPAARHRWHQRRVAGRAGHAGGQRRAQDWQGQRGVGASNQGGDLGEALPRHRLRDLHDGLGQWGRHCVWPHQTLGQADHYQVGRRGGGGLCPQPPGALPAGPQLPVRRHVGAGGWGSKQAGQLGASQPLAQPPLRSSTRRPALRVASSKLGHSSSSAECTGGFHFHWELSGAARSRRRCHRRNQTSIRSRPTPALLHTYLASWLHWALKSRFKVGSILVNLIYSKLFLGNLFSFWNIGRQPPCAACNFDQRSVNPVSPI